MNLYCKTEKNSMRASDIIRYKLYECGGKATVYSVTGKPYIIKAANDGCSFLCSGLPMPPPYTYHVFNVIVDFLVQQGGRARKGNGRNYRLGEGNCSADTVVWAIGKNYLKAAEGASVVDPAITLTIISTPSSAQLTALPSASSRLWSPWATAPMPTRSRF